MFQYFAAAFFDKDYFTTKITAAGKLKMPVLVMGGEASFAPTNVQVEAFEPVAANFETSIVPKAGHWIVSASFASLQRQTNSDGGCTG